MHCAFNVLLVFFAVALAVPAAEPLKVLIIDGQNNHAWRETTPVLRQILEDTGIFTVEVATTPEKGGDLNGFRPDFAAFDVVLSNYNGDAWPPEAQATFEQFVREGGGFVVYHAADNAFPNWAEYNRMIGLGGWGDRTEAHGPMLFYEKDRVRLDSSSGKGGHHGKRHEFLLVTREPKHAIMKGLPKAWMHATDELYDSLRGPARDLEVLATAYSAPATGGTGRDEPMLFTIRYGEGRVFHTTLGHDVSAMRCVGFITTLQRGTEWAATGRVRQKAPRDFPTTMRVSTRGN